jgi:hypothetical protein
MRSTTEKEIVSFAVIQEISTPRHNLTLDGRGGDGNGSTFIRFAGNRLSNDRASSNRPARQPSLVFARRHDHD